MSVGPESSRRSEADGADRWLGWALFVGALAAAVTFFLAIALTFTWRPAAGDAFVDLQQTQDRGVAPLLSAAHLIASWVLVLAAAAVLGLATWSAARARSGPVQLIGVTVGGTVVLVFAFLATVTRPIVQWHQLAVFAVTVEADMAGYWTAAFHSDVRFVLVDTTEISQGDYRFALAVHLVAPVLAGLGLAAMRATRSPITPSTDG